MKAFKVTGLALALDGSEDNLFDHLFQGTEAGAEDHDIDPELEDDEDLLASDSHSDSVTNCISGGCHSHRLNSTRSTPPESPRGPPSHSPRASARVRTKRGGK